MSETRPHRDAAACMPPGVTLLAYFDSRTDAERALFAVGTLSITPGVRDAMDADNMEGWHRMVVLFRKHQQGEWENHDDDDTRENWRAIPDGNRIFTVWEILDRENTGRFMKLWIITEADRSSTTALLPAEY